jgi:hypothetical protein
MSSVLEAVLKLRPSSVASRLSGTCVCLLNARDIQRSVGLGTVVVAFEVPAPALAQGIVRAARQVGAVVGLSFPALQLGESPRSHAVVQSLVAAIEEAGLTLPIFFRGGPVLLQEASEGAVAQARETVFRLIDAGFTEVSMDASGLDPAEAAAAIAEAAAPLRERELSLDITSRLAEPDAVTELVGSLGAQGVRVDVLTVPGAALAAVDDLTPLEKAARPAVLSVLDPQRRLRGTGARRAVASAPFCRILASALGAEAREAVRARALQGVPVPAALAATREAAALDEEAQLRLEALSYHEALEILADTGGQGSGTASLSFLAEKSGY